MDIIRLGRASARGGLTASAGLDDAIENSSLHAIAEQLSFFDAAMLAAIGNELEKLASTREPIEQLVGRDWSWISHEMTWTTRLDLWLDKWLMDDDYFGAGMRIARTRTDARVRVLVAEAAVRRHVLAEGSPPESLESLVPKYLSAVPIDPFSNRPLVYCRTVDGYLLYSVGGNGRDDGGERVSIVEAFYEDKGDLFFDAPEQASIPANPAQGPSEP